MAGLSNILHKLVINGTSSLRGIRRGLEKEALRITPAGKLAQTPHPATLGSALTHPYITTDFSEALLEFITPPCTSIDEMLQWMNDIHSFSYQKIQPHNELLWVASMPCVIESEDLIPIAQYGTSHPARMKHTYRVGLSHRYGRTMQTIAGIHYNFSLPDEFWKELQAIENASGLLQDYKTEKYFSLIRNFRRYFWLLLYFFGSAPAICPTFVRQRQHSLQKIQNHSLYYPMATSLRMGELGYQSNAQSSIMADYNSLEGYIASLLAALTKPHPDYEKIGVCENGVYKQLNANLLQIENEFYSPVRPKRVAHNGEAPILALHRRGVEYIEVRSVDINPFNPVGIDSIQAHFIEVFLLFCLLEESPPTDPREYQQITENQRSVVNKGRDPELEIFCHGSLVKLRNCAGQLLEKLEDVSSLLADTLHDDDYRESVRKQKKKIHDDQLTPSAYLLEEMKKNDLSFFELVYRQSCEYQQYFLSYPLPPDRKAWFEKLAGDSLIDQQAIEAADSGTFTEYLDTYFKQYYSPLP